LQEAPALGQIHQVMVSEGSMSYYSNLIGLDQNAETHV